MVKLDTQGNNVATIWTAPGYSRYHAFATKCGPEEDFITCNAMMIRDDEASAGEEGHKEEEDNYFDSRQSPLQAEFNLEGPKDLYASKQPSITMDEEDQIPLQARGNS
jgi:hypothetical protein